MLFLICYLNYVINTTHKKVFLDIDKIEIINPSYSIFVSLNKLQTYVRACRLIQHRMQSFKIKFHIKFSPDKESRNFFLVIPVDGPAWEMVSEAAASATDVMHAEKIKKYFK